MTLLLGSYPGSRGHPPDDDTGLPTPFSVALVLKHGADLLAQFRRTFMAVRRDGVLNRCLENFFLGAGNFQGAIFLAWVVAAVDRFTCCHN